MISVSSLVPVLSNTATTLQPVFYEVANGVNYELSKYLVPGFIAVIAMKKIGHLLLGLNNTRDNLFRKAASRFGEFISVISKNYQLFYKKHSVKDLVY